MWLAGALGMVTSVDMKDARICCDGNLPCMSCWAVGPFHDLCLHASSPS